VAAQRVGAGTVLAGRFRLEDLLEDTEGARFWRATDQTLARNVTVHVIPREDRRADALLAAARTSATVADGHLLRVLDAAAEDGVVYVVNEWGSGVSLDRLLEDGPLPPRRAAWVVKEVAETISTAHRHGIAHGRLLPENVMVTEAGSVKLIGFVIDAVLRGRESIQTTGGHPLGEHEADVVNLGALLYAALVGRWPGTRGSVVPPAPTEHGRALRPRQVRAGVPRPLDAICDRVLNPGVHSHLFPNAAAPEIYAALCDFIGDPAGLPPVGHEPTTMLDQRTPTSSGGDAGPPTQLHPAPTAPSGQPPDDSEATQAGTPVFSDDSGIGWVTGAERRGLRGEDTAARRTPPPPPVLPDPEPKPLFAPGPPRATRPVRSTGAGNGSLPPAWGPDRDEGPPDDRGPADGEDSGRSWLRLAGALAGVVVLVVALVFAFNLGRGSDSAPSSPGSEASSANPAPKPKPVQIAGVSDFDPEATPPEENPQEAPLAIDGNPATAWETVTYYRADLGGLKSGVGLRLDLGRTTKVTAVHLTLGGSPTDLQILAARKGATEPQTTDGLKKVAARSGAGGTVNLTLSRPVETRYLVVWLTSLPPVGGGYKGQIAEVSVLS
jgi:hypothetical protein